MRKFTAGVAMGLAVSWAVAYAAPNLRHDGKFWNRLNSSAKQGYVNGYSDAMGVSVGKLSALEVAANTFHWKGGRKIIRQLARQLSMAGFGPAEAVHRLDALYSNSQYSDLDLGSALQLLSLRKPATAVPAGPKSGRR